MNKKILALMLTTVMTVGTAIPAFATPDNAQLNEGRQKYAEIES